MSHLVRAVDLGFGNVKYINGYSPSAELQCGYFPSLAPLASPHALSVSVLEKKDTVLVESNGRLYEVGPGIGTARRGQETRVLNSEYIRTPEYLALLRGALHYMRVPELDLLVVGLPIGLAQKRGRELEQLATGSHPTSHGERVTVHSAYCLPQPVGGFFYYALTNGQYQVLKNQVNLVIDVGFFTLDWLVCDGLTPIIERSSHVDGGVSAVLRNVADAVGRDHDTNYTNIAALDAALNTGFFKVHGKTVPIARYLRNASSVVEQALLSLTNSVGDATDIDNVFVVGGGATLYMHAIQTLFKRYPVLAVKDPMYANVRGFQLAGEQIIRQRHVA